MVTERQNEILNLVVDIFTKTHEPVGSKALQDVIQSSSATIRNDMAALEKARFTRKSPHFEWSKCPAELVFNILFRTRWI